MLRVNRERLFNGTLTNDDVRDYGLADGLRGTEGVKRQQSVFTDSLGRIWFSVNQGISVVDPARVTGSSAPAMADIQMISADGAPVALTNPIRIGPGHHRIVFGYAGLILSVPERVRYRYWLEGYDREWSEAVAEQEAGYTNLGPRSYRFHVMASNPDGVWNKKKRQLVSKSIRRIGKPGGLKRGLYSCACWRAWRSIDCVCGSWLRG